MNKTKVKLLIIDLYGVMSHGSYKDTARWIGKKYHLYPDDVYAIMYHKYFEKAVMGKIPERRAFYETCKALKLQETWSELRTKHLSFQRLNQAVFVLCKNLQKKGYKIVILSKNTPSQFRYTLKIFKLRKHFKNIINTFDLRLPKASPKTLKYLMKKFKVTPEEIVMTDDQDFNLVSPKKLGVKTILYKNFPNFKKSLFSHLQ